jgi:hypothetical protein
MKRILILMMQPPGCSSVQGLRYAKLLPFLEKWGWEFHFCGPMPDKTSVLTESVEYPQERLHYTNAVPLSLEASVRKNRHKKGSLLYVFFGAIQLVSTMAERLLSWDRVRHMQRGMIKQALAAEMINKFDLIAGKSPDFQVLETAAYICRIVDKPFLAIYDDPHGHRDLKGFYPADESRQKAVLKQAQGAVFMSPLTRERYIECCLAERDRSFAMSDSYPEDPRFYRRSDKFLPQDNRHGESSHEQTIFSLAHLGNLPEWRPIDSFVEALRRFRSLEGDLEPSLVVNTYGYVYQKAKDMIASIPSLSQSFNFYPAVSHEESHLVAESSDIMLVMIGPRHTDNQPSKFFVYLGHAKPILAIGPRGNPIEAIINKLAIGVYAAIGDEESIFNGIMELTNNYEGFRQAFSANKSELQEFSSRRVAERWCEILDLVNRNSPQGRWVQDEV